MKQVFNWTIGSFFRTIGRTIAFLVMGGLIYYILTTNGFEFGLKELFFDNVKADSQTSAWWETYYTSSAKTTQFTYTANYAKGQLTASGNDINVLDFWLGTNITKRANEDYVLIPIMLLGESYNYSQNNQRDWICKEWLQTDFDTNGQYNGYECKWVSYEQTTDTELAPIQFKMNLKLRAINGSDAMCTLEGNMAKCYLKSGETYGSIRVEYNYSLSNYTSLYIGLNRGISTYKDGITNVSESINQQTQQQQQQHEEIMDDNTTQAESEATDFFEDFEAPDIGGLGAIITAPLNTIRSLLNSSCTNLVLPLPFVNENLTLPCMNTIYTQHFGAFFSIYQTIILAIIAYRCIRSIFFDIHGFTNPNDDRIEVMDL